MAIFNIMLGIGILGVTFYYLFFNVIPKKSTTEKCLLPKGEKLYSYLLDKCNCEYNWEHTDSYSETDFSYQGGYFCLRVFNDSTARLFYLMQPEDFSKIQNVQLIINNINRIAEYINCTYSINIEENTVAVWFSHRFVALTYEVQMLDYFKAVLNDCFRASRYFYDEFNKLKDKDGDAVMENYKTRRLNYLLFEQEIQHNSIDDENREKLPVCSSSESEISLASVLQTLFLLDVDKIQQVKILKNGKLSVVTDKDEISNIHIWSLLCDSLGKEAAFKVDSVTFMVDTDDDQHVIITVQTLLEDEKRLYARISGYLQNRIVTLEKDRYAKQDADFYSVCVAYDKMTDGDRSAEYDFLVQDAIEKMRENKRAELTEEQEFIVENNIVFPNRDFFYGKKYFLEKRYFESLCCFKRCYAQMQADYQRLKDSDKDIFFSVCYYIGFCYMEIHQYEKACMYLEIAAETHTISYTMEYVNCLANSRDFRAGAVIDRILSEVYQQHSKQELEDHAGLTDFLNFLRRRRAYVCIDLGDLDSAEEQFKEMLNEPENEQYALKELVYIKQLREKYKNNNH